MFDIYGSFLELLLSFCDIVLVKKNVTFMSVVYYFFFFGPVIEETKMHLGMQLHAGHTQNQDLLWEKLEKRYGSGASVTEVKEDLTTMSIK